jgi:hypothetical protein
MTSPSTTLTALQAHLLAMGPTVTLAASDTQLPAQLIAFLTTVPGWISIQVRPDGITLADSTLTVTGISVTAWEITGLPHTPLRITNITVTVTAGTATDGSATLTVSATASGVIAFGNQDVGVNAVSATLPDGLGGTVPGWRIGVPNPAEDVRPMDLLDVGMGGHEMVPALGSMLEAISQTGALAPGSVDLVFYPATGFSPSLAFTITVPHASWNPAPSMFSFTGVDILGAVSPDAYQITLVGHLLVGAVAMDVGVGFQLGNQLTAFVRPTHGGAFPGLVALAQWAGGSALATKATGGLQTMGFATGPFDAAITSASLAVDVGAQKLLYLEVVSLISLGALQFDVALRLPNLSITGTLRDGTPVGAAALLASLSLPSAGVPAALSITEALFSAYPSAGVYGAELTLSDVWTIGPVSVAEVSLAVAFDPGNGLTGSVGGVLALGASIAVQLDAAYVDAMTGWQFSGATFPGGTLAIGDLISTLATSFGISTVPQVLRSLALNDVSASYATGTGNFAFGCTGSFTVAGTAATLEIDIAITNAAAAPTGKATTVGSAGYAATYSGILTIGQLTFSVVFDLTATGTDVVLGAAWQAPTSTSYLGLADLTTALGLPNPQLPASLDVRLSAASVSYHVSTGQLLITAQSASYGKAVFVVLPPPASGATTNAYLAAFAVGDRIDLSDIPLLGEALGDADSCAVESLQVVLSGAAIAPAVAVAANALIPAGYPTIPPQGTASAVALSAVLRFGQQTIPVALGVAAPPSDGSPPPSEATVGPSEGGDGVVVRPATGSDGTVWLSVQKAFGPVTFERVGVRFAGGVLWFLLDASLVVGGLELTLWGASVGSPIGTFAPQFSLRGLGVSYQNPPLEIGGSFASVAPTGGATFQYDGAVVISLPSVGLTAYGSYAEVDGEPSMFVFLKAGGNFGGPPAFYVTGLAGGFGYNSSVRIPGADQVVNHPLVAGLSDPSKLGGANASPMQALAALAGGTNPWITHALGHTWLAAGVRFSTFQLLDSTALLVVEFGNGLTVLLMGLSTARFPSSGAARPYAQIQLQLRALFRPTDGFFGINASLTRNSYLIDPACVLTGGFAFFVWFAPSPQAGDFVVVLGGYHPAFAPPAHYPVVPRIGFSWALDSTVSISGTAYFALTPSAIMAGGALDIRYHDGNLTAWFTAHADLIITWNPFHFNVSIGVSVGVEYKVNLLFTTKTLHLEAGAELTLWGPPTGGTVTVKLWVVTFTVGFGAPATANQPPLTWTQFQALLPPATGSTTFTATSGLAAQPTANAALAAPPVGGAPWTVRADGFSVATRSAVPSTRLFLGPTTQTPTRTGSQINIRPMRSVGLTVDQRVVLTTTTGGASTTVDLAATGWTVTPVTSNVPKALWGTGTGAQLDPGNAQLVTGQLTGLTIAAPPPVAGWSTSAIDGVHTLGVAAVTPTGGMPLSGTAAAAGGVAQQSTGAVAAIAAQIMAPNTETARDSLFAALTALGVAPDANEPLVAFVAQTGTLYNAQPLLTGTAP